MFTEGFLNIANRFFYENIKKTMKGREVMEKWKCQICGYVYDPETGDSQNGIAPGIPFEALPEDWVCPECGAPKSQFEKI